MNNLLMGTPYVSTVGTPYDQRVGLPASLTRLTRAALAHYRWARRRHGKAIDPSISVWEREGAPLTRSVSADCRRALSANSLL